MESARKETVTAVAYPGFPSNCYSDPSQKRYVYWWADGVYFNVRLDEERTCVLVLIGATEDGTKELIAVVDGYRESTQSWRELLGAAQTPGAFHRTEAGHRRRFAWLLD